jgi:hypothetical protein
MPCLRALAASATLILLGITSAMGQPAMGQQNPPSDQTAPTDIGRTSTKGREGPPQEVVVKPSATVNRADAAPPNRRSMKPNCTDRTVPLL